MQYNDIKIRQVAGGKSEKQELISNNLEGEIEESMLEQPPKGLELHNNLKESCSQENKAPQQPETSRAHE